MSTTGRLLDDEDLAGMTAELKEWPNSTWGSDEQALGVSPFLTFYFLYDSQRSTETALLMVDIHEAFEHLTGESYSIGTHPDSEKPHRYGSKRLPDLREVARTSKSSDYFSFKVSSELNHRSSPATAGYFWKLRDYMNDRDDPSNRAYSSIQFYYRWAWFKESKNAWRGFVLQSIERLRPEVVYSGFAFANPLEHGTRAEVSVWERALTPRFYGLDIDFPFGMDRLGDGIRPPTWGFLLSDVNCRKLALSREQVRDRLHHPAINIFEVQNGLWIELGDEPSLFPVEDGVPALPKMLNHLLKPIRNDHTDLLGFAQWDGDPNERFNSRDTMRWLQRFDDDSDWPSIEERRASLK